MHIQVGAIDYAIMAIYVIFVLGIGWVLKRSMKTSSDFLTSGKSIPAWITGLAFISTNLGALEVIGMGASGAKYGITTCHFYWVGAIPAMVFLGVFMMPFYYGSKARSVPEYLKLRFNEKTRGFNAITFAIMTIFASGISMFAMAKLMEICHLFRFLHLSPEWYFLFCILVSGLIVLGYTFLGGLTSAIYNEVLQFFLIVAGFVPLVYLGLKDAGGWSGVQAGLQSVARNATIIAGSAKNYAPDAWTRSWAHMGSPSGNPMGVEWFGLIFGLGFVLSFGYWCTNFLVVQRAMAAKSMSAARNTPLIGAIPKMFIPILVILPGMIAIALTAHGGVSGFSIPLDTKHGGLDYNNTIPAILLHYLPSGVLGLGLTALMASFMSGMAGNVTAFNTVWTYDIYQSYIKPGQSDKHYLRMGHMATIFGIIVSMGAAYMARNFNNIMDFLQLIFAFVNAPLFATFLLGMFWKRATGNAAFVGLISGTLGAAVHHGLTQPAGAASLVKGGWLGKVVYTYPSEMAQNFWTALIAWTICFAVTIIISMITKRTKTDDDLRGLVYSLTPKIKQTDIPWYSQPAMLGTIILAVAVVLNIIFW